MIKIYGMSGSPFVRRTELVLTEKSVDYELITLSRASGDLQTPEHLARNPRGRVPVLADGDLILYESQAIVEYLEDRYPEPALVPAARSSSTARRREQPSRPVTRSHE